MRWIMKNHENDYQQNFRRGSFIGRPAGVQTDAMLESLLWVLAPSNLLPAMASIIYYRIITVYSLYYRLMWWSIVHVGVHTTSGAHHNPITSRHPPLESAACTSTKHYISS